MGHEWNEMGPESDRSLPGDDRPDPETMTVLCVGGRRHGESVTLPVGSTNWVDLMSAETYYPKEFKYVRRDPVNPMSLSLRTGYKAHALVHESIVQDGQLAQQWWMGLALERMFAAVGREVPIAEIMANRPPESPNGRSGSAGN